MRILAATALLLIVGCSAPCVRHETELYPIWPKPRSTQLTSGELLEFATFIASATGELTGALRDSDDPKRAYDHLHRAFNVDGLLLRLLLEDPEASKCARGGE